MKTSRNAVFGNASVAVLRLCERKMLVMGKKRKELCVDRTLIDSRCLGGEQRRQISSLRR